MADLSNEGSDRRKGVKEVVDKLAWTTIGDLNYCNIVGIQGST